MEKRGMNERVQALRELSVTTQPHIDMERAKSETATYKKYEGQLSVPELRAQVYMTILQQRHFTSEMES